MSREPIRSEVELDDEQRTVLAWVRTAETDEALDRVKAHCERMAHSLRLAFRNQEALLNIILSGTLTLEQNATIMRVADALKRASPQELG